MSHRPVNRDEVIAALTEGTPLITATPRLATEWKRSFFLGSREEVSTTPPVFFWDEWIKQLSHAAALPIPLTKIQELLLWEEIIRHDLKTTHLAHHTSQRGLARRASEAFARMQEYRIKVSELALGGEESEALARWIKAMEAKLATPPFKERMLAAETVPLLAASMQKKAAPAAIMLDGFEWLAPAQQQLLARLESFDCTVHGVHADRPQTVPTLTCCPDEQAEFNRLAARLQTLLEQQPQSQIAILTHETFAAAAPLRRTLDQQLMPESRHNPYIDRQAVAMQGDPLAEWPMIQQTLHLLSLAAERSIAFNDFSTLLFSPWLQGFAAEQMPRAELDALFRRQNRHRISFKRLLQSADLQALPALHGVIQTLAAWPTARQSASQWIKAVHALLQNSGMTQAGLDHHDERSDVEIRQMNAFRDLLTSLAAADAIHASMPWPQFLSLLRSACAETTLPLPAKHPNVTLLPLTQIAGLSFDHIFVIGMDEQAFPPAARPQPLLPLPLQKRYRIPMSHGALQFDSSQWLWQRLLQAAPVIEISFASRKEERELHPSSFVKNLTTEASVESRKTEATAELESYIDSAHVPLNSGEKIRGGTTIIKNQSACPFRAFITHRLNTAALGETTPGIEPTTKGSLIHVALEFIWNQLKSQAALLALGENERDGIIERAIEKAWEANRSPHHPAIQKFEKNRMRRVLSQWLELECSRPAFQVAATEQSFLLQLPENSPQPLQLRISADRIDIDNSGRRILIDYKTGAKQSAAKWLGKRMEEPQLPLYALAAKLGEHDAVTFATVRSGRDMGFEGLAGDDTGISGIAACDGKRNRPESWAEVLGEWEREIHALAEEFVEGRSEVSPRDNRACNYCGFEAICRIEETGFAIDSEDET